MDEKRKPKEPGAPEEIVHQDTTPIEVADPDRYFDSSSEGLRCQGCHHYLAWTDVSRVWWCLDIRCRLYRKKPVR